MLSFLKLTSSNSNLMAVIYNLDANGNLSGSSGFGVMANDDCNFANIPAGTYAILVGSATGTEIGDYTLMWNCSTPSNYIYTDKNNVQHNVTPHSLLSVSDDLTNILVYYDTQAVLINGTNALYNLIWEDSQTWTNNYGYTARDMKFTLYEWSRLYLANITTTAPCSVPRALMIEVRKGMWRYCNSYYYNNAGDLKHEMNYTDLSGIKTPRVFGEEATDFEYGPSYLVVDLDTLKVVDYISPFNYYYQVGGRTYTSSNVQQLT